MDVEAIIGLLLLGGVMGAFVTIILILIVFFFEPATSEFPGMDKLSIFSKKFLKNKGRLLVLFVTSFTSMFVLWKIEKIELTTKLAGSITFLLSMLAIYAIDYMAEQQNKNIQTRFIFGALVYAFFVSFIFVLNLTTGDNHDYKTLASCIAGLVLTMFIAAIQLSDMDEKKTKNEN